LNGELGFGFKAVGYVDVGTGIVEYGGELVASARVATESV
jgi:hypothetical protein